MLKPRERERERERDEAEQHGYDVGVAETDDALRVEVPAVCRGLLCSDLGRSSQSS